MSSLTDVKMLLIDWRNGNSDARAAKYLGPFYKNQAAFAIGTVLEIASTCAVLPAVAQEQVLEEIIVTGSRIKRTDFTSASPISVIDADALRMSGTGDLGETLRRSITSGSGGFNQSSTLSGGGATSIDLRNLGQDRTLVLINGKRLASFADALANEAADLKLIPNAMVERVEILRDGASAVYGADAVSGVVNVILKDDFEGVEISAQGGIAGENDADFEQLGITMGTSGDRGNTIFSLEHRHREPVANRDRDWAFPNITSIRETSTRNGSFFSTGGIFLGDDGAEFCTEPLLLGGDERTNVSPDCPSNRDQSNTNEVARYDYGLVQDMANEYDIATAALFTNYQMTDNINWFSELQYSKRQSIIFIDGNPGSNGTATIPDGWRVPEANPNNPTGEDGSFFVRPTTTVGPRKTDIEADTARIVLGLEGDIATAGFFNDWSWELSYLYTRTTSTAQTKSTWNLLRANIISDPARCATDAICSGIVNSSGALDVFRPANWTDDEIAYIRQDTTATAKFQTSGWFGVLSGPIVTLPAGDLGVAIGFESRRDKGEHEPDPVTAAGESVANQVFPTSGSFTVDEAFAEVEIPLLKDFPAVQGLNLNLQYRYSDYDSFGGESVYRAGLDWQIVGDLRLRGSFSTAYRAPKVTDLFSGGVVSFDFFTDLCTDSAARSANATLNANCLADRVPLGATQLSNQYPVLAGGNSELKPETADTYTIGLVYSPSFVEGVSITIDVWDIEVEDIIDRPESDLVVDACYLGPAGLAAPECARFGRNATTFAIQDLENALVNFEEVTKTNGFDWRVNYLFDAAGVGWEIDWQGTYIDENNLDDFPEAGGADDRGSIPRIKSSALLSAQLENWRISWLIDYIHSMKDPQFDKNTNVLGYEEIDAHIEHNMRIGYNWEDRYRLTFGVNDLFDADPEFIQASSTNTDTFTYDVIGRYYFLQFTANF